MVIPSRRGLAATALTAALASAAVVATAAVGQQDGSPGDGGRQAKNIILLIGDGMGTTHIDAARLRYEGAAGQLNMERLPALGTVSTYAVEEDSDKPEYVTDSASAATAWSSGVKTYNNAIGKDAYKRVVATLMEQAKAAGMRTGNVTNSEITDATPAGMFAHVSRRACQGPGTAGCTDGDEPIAEQIANSTTADVIFGGGLSRFEPADEAALEANGYQILAGDGAFGDAAVPAQTAATQRTATRAQLRGLSAADDNASRVIGLFNRGNMTVEQAKRLNPTAPEAAEPSVGEMTTKALEILSRSEQGRDQGFLLQVEGALIDKRSHANDAAQTLEEMHAFDDAVRRATQFARREGNTLVIVTADHECAGFNIIDPSSFANAEAATPPGNVDSSNPANNSVPSRATATTRDPARSAGPINGTGATSTTNFAPAYFRTADDPASVADGDPEGSLALTYLSGNHTGQDVQIFAYGPRHEAFDQHLDNTDIYYEMRSALTALSG